MDLLREKTEKLWEKLSQVQVNNISYDFDFCSSIVNDVDAIEKLKKQKNAIILTHSYVHPEIVFSVSDFVGDSYGLAKKAQGTSADIIVFAAVKFMAETAKLLNPEKTVLFPNKNGGCSLADSITGEDVKKLKAQFPDHTFVCYINTSAEVKAECDVCVTSSNVYKIVEEIPNKKIFFLPDRLMGLNIIDYCLKNKISKDIKIYDGTCYVHEEYKPEVIDYWKAKFPDLFVLVHPECDPSVAQKADFVGSTSEMIEKANTTNSKNILMLTECGLVSRLQGELGEKKNFIGTCVMCKYMKSNTLKDIRRVLEKPTKEDVIEINPEIASRAVKCIEKMFEYA